MTDWVDETTVVDIVYLYFRKAFDTATHQIVTEKLVKHGLEELKNGQTDIVNPWSPKLKACPPGMASPVPSTEADHCPSLAGHPVSDTSQEAIGLLGYLGTLLAHVQLAVDQHPQVLLCQAISQTFCPQPVVLHEVVATHMQNPSLLVDPHTIGLFPLIQPVQIPLQTLPTFQQMKIPTRLGVICKLTEGVLQCEA
ncbi:hypothetical protein HGM15179_015300 [Zosterops borbonicus]|uniref:Uncharacterized protein n=1 Tax=Zosterops borbonicus TaxID=364589 RepID=A0A8K1LFG1_9PASS|nr:hypothetical protein HGM15179_015300 [Zosterops borbonicus]